MARPGHVCDIVNLQNFFMIWYRCRLLCSGGFMNWYDILGASVIVELGLETLLSGEMA